MPLPEAKHLLVAQQHVAARFEIVVLLDAGAGDRLADLHAVLLLDEGDIVDDEAAGLADRAEILDDPFRADQPVAAAVEGPGAAECAIPRAAARELDRGARVERAEKIFAAVAQQVARRQQLVERVDEARRRPLAVRGHDAGHRGDIAAGLERREQQRDRRLALALEDAVDRAIAMRHQRLGGERGAVSADADKGVRQPRLRRLCEIDDLGHVGQVVARKGDELPAATRPSIRK